MALHNGIDAVAIATYGNYSETYSSLDPENQANLLASMGYMEDLPGGGEEKFHYLKKIKLVLKEPTFDKRHHHM